jgi:hypothetical protein
VDGGLGNNNPVRALLDEASHIWPKRKVGCIVSIGTGVPSSINVGKKLKPLIECLKSMSTDTEEIAKEMRKEMVRKYVEDNSVYFRFNVTNGLENVSLEEWKRLDTVKVATEEYTSNE